MAGRFTDEFDEEYSEQEIEVFAALPESKKDSLKYGSLESANIIERDLDSFSQEQKQLALSRFKLLSLVNKELVGGWTPKNLNPLIDKHFKQSELETRPSYKSLKRWKDSFEQSGGDFTSLVQKHHLKGNRTIRITGDESQYDEALQKFLDAKRPSISAAYNYYCDKIEVENATIVSGKIPRVSYVTFKNRINKEQPYSVVLARHGKYYADKLFNYYQNVEMPTRVLERVEMDHTPLDLILLHDDLLVPLGRAHLTLLVDVFSGCIVGFHLGFKHPSYVSASKAIIHATKNKDYISKLPIEFENKWLCEGKIENLVVDNGAEFWSKSLEDACLEAGINVVFNKVRKPWLKPFVERKFGEIIQGIVGWVPGKTFSNVLEKEDYKPEKDAVMRFSVFVEELHRWIVDVHNVSADTRFKRIPNLYWQQGVDVMPPLKLQQENEKAFTVVMGSFHERKLTSKGIKFMHLEYDSKALVQYRRQYPQTKATEFKKIKVDPDDLSSIYIYLEELKGYLEVPCKDSNNYTYRLSLCEHQKILEAHRRYIKGEINTLSLAKARLAMHERIKSEQSSLKEMELSDRKRKAKASKKIAEYTGVNSDHPKSNLDDRSPKNGTKTSPSTKEQVSISGDSLRDAWNKRRSER